MPSNVTGELVAEVTALQGVVPSAIALINGFVARMEAAVAEAVRLNDEADLSAVTDEVNKIKTERQALADAVAANG
jgi:hypothetical protein